MKRLVLLAVLLVGCRAPVVPRAGHADSYQRAVQMELLGETDRAIDAALEAIADDASPGADATQAALELLTHRVTAPLGPLEDISLAARTTRSLVGPLEELLLASTGDKRMYLSLALFHLAARPGGSGEAAVAKHLRCLDQVAMLGPMASFFQAEPVSQLGSTTFSQRRTYVRDRGCELSLAWPSARTGSRRVQGSYDVSRAGTLRVAWLATNAAVLRVNRRSVSERAFSAGPGSTLNVVRAPVSAGRLEVEVNAWMGTPSDRVAVFAWVDDQPLAASDSGSGSGSSEATVGPVFSVAATSCANDACLATHAGALMFRGDARAVQALLADRVTEARPTNPALALSYVRALRRSRDLPKAEMLRTAGGLVADVITSESRSWEGVATNAAITAETKGGPEGCRAALAGTNVDRLSKDGRALVAMIGSSCWLTSGQSGRARLAIDGILKETAVFRVADAQAFPRAPIEQEWAVCAARGKEACANFRRDSGRLAEARQSLEDERLRKGAPQVFAAQLAEIDCLLKKENGSDRALFDGERSVALGSCLGNPAASEAMPDVPRSLLTVARRDLPVPFEGLAEKVLAKSKVVQGDATVVLEHQERYAVAGGILGFEIFDLRRLGGTTDIEQNAQADVPAVDGLVSHRVVRRRIFKRDGRVIEPNHTPNATQAGADLVQLETGDSVESIVIGAAVPDARGYLAFDTPDLLTERTQVEHVRIEIKAPETFTMHAHRLLGLPREVLLGKPRCSRRDLLRGSNCWAVRGEKATVYEAHKLGPRNIEWRGLLLDRPVSVLATSDTWRGVGSRLASALVALDDSGDAEVRNLVSTAGARNAKTKLEAVRALVKYVGDRLRVASPWLLADSGFVRTEGAFQQSARSMLLAREGSRTWVVHRALRELGIASEVLVVEPESVSEDKDPIVHPGRFTHPLLLATIDGKSVFIDSDVSGAPLPVGQVSPELVGRPMLHTDGRIDTLSRELVKIDRDEVYLKLRLAANGDATGDVVVQVGGPGAQELDEALLRLVGEPRAYLMRSLVQAWVPGADLLRVDAAREGERMVVRASVSVPRYAEREGNSMRLRLPGLAPFHRSHPVSASTLTRTYGARSDRTSALVIRDAIQYHLVREVELPAGFDIGNHVDDEEIREASLVATRHTKRVLQAVNDEFLFELRPDVVPPKQYAAFLALARRIDESFLASVVLAPGRPTKLEAAPHTQVR